MFYEGDQWSVSKGQPTPEEEKVLHQTIKKIEDGIERFAFNTCVSAFMIAVNDLKKLNCNNKSILTSLNRLLAPFAPFTSEEIHQLFGGTRSVHHADWPTYDDSKVKEDEIAYPLSINGKKRGEVTFPSNADKSAIEKEVVSHEVVLKWSEGKKVRKVIIVPGRMINVVIG